MTHQPSPPSHPQRRKRSEQPQPKISKHRGQAPSLVAAQDPRFQRRAKHSAHLPARRFRTLAAAWRPFSAGRVWARVRPPPGRHHPAARPPPLPVRLPHRARAPCACPHRVCLLDHAAPRQLAALGAAGGLAARTSSLLRARRVALPPVARPPVAWLRAPLPSRRRRRRLRRQRRRWRI